MEAGPDVQRGKRSDTCLCEAHGEGGLLASSALFVLLVIPDPLTNTGLVVLLFLLIAEDAEA